MRIPTLRQLEVFAAIARHKSFTRAAEELYLTQSSVSNQFKQLTELIGFPLIEQIGKKIYITEIGSRVLDQYVLVSDNWRDFEKDILYKTDPHRGTVFVSGVDTSQYFFPRSLGRFTKQYPNINVVVSVESRQSLIERIYNNKDHLYIVGQVPNDADLKVIPFLPNPLVLVARPNHPLRHERNIEPTQLKDEIFITREHGSGTALAVKEFLSSNDMTFKTKIEMGSNEGIKQAIMGGLGVSILSKWVINLELQMGLLVTLDVKGFPVNKDWYVGYPFGKELPPVARTFLDFLKDEGRDITSGSLDNCLAPYCDA